jgi:peptide deformylase
MKPMRRTQFGNPVLREAAPRLTSKQILSIEVQDMLRRMRYTLETKRYGVGLAAPQVGESLAIALIGLKPTPTRPNTQTLSMTLINPEIISKQGKLVGMWEACISGPDLYGKAIRYEKIRISWLDDKAKPHEQNFEGLVAQVIQHEIDHLNGILFVDRVKDPKTYVTFSEYKKIRKAEKNKSK